MRQTTGRTSTWPDCQVLRLEQRSPVLALLPCLSSPVRLRKAGAVHPPGPRQNSCRLDSSWPNLSIRKVDHVRSQRSSRASESHLYPNVLKLDGF